MTKTKIKSTTLTPEEWYESRNVSIVSEFVRTIYKNRPHRGWFDMPESPMMNTAILRLNVNNGNRIVYQLK